MRYLHFLLILFLTMPPVLAEDAQQDESSVDSWSVDRIARELFNPVSPIRAVFNDFEYRSYQGDLPSADDQSAWIYKLRPSIPIRLDNGRNILLRATIPIYMDQPLWEVPFGHPLWQLDVSYADWRIRQSPEITAGTGAFQQGHNHLADVGFDVAYGGVSDSGFISMYGIATVFPTSQDLSAGRDHWQMGPEVAFGKQADWGVIGLWATHLFKLTGEDAVGTNDTTLEFFFAYGLDNGWQVTSNPKILYDWEAVDGERLQLPIGGGFAKTGRLGKMPLRFAMELYYYVESPDRFGPEWMLTINLTPVLSGWLMD